MMSVSPKMMPAASGINGPQQNIMELKGQVDKKFHQHHQPAGKNKRPTEYKQVSTVQVAQQDDHCRDNNACRPHHRKSKGKEPTPTGGQIDIQQVNPQRHKSTGTKMTGFPLRNHSGSTITM